MHTAILELANPYYTEKHLVVQEFSKLLIVSVGKLC